MVEAWVNTKTRLATEKVTQDLVDSLIREIRSNVDDDTLVNDLVMIMENAVSDQTWNEMFHQLGLAQDGCRFFSKDTLRLLRRHFRIQQIDDFQIELTTTHKVSLVAHEKILDGQEAAMVTLAEIRKHQDR